MDKTNTDNRDSILVSIITPVYNCEKYISKCIESIIQQDHKNFEAIFIDDGSEDKSGEICDKYAGIDKRIKVFHTENNGPSAARNIGLKEMKGQYLFLLDSDDTIEKDALNILLNQHIESGAELTISSFNKMDENNNITSTSQSFPEDRFLNQEEVVDCAERYIREPNKFLLFAFSWGRLFNANIIRDNNIFFDPKLRTFEDVSFNYEYMPYISKIRFLKRPLYNYMVQNLSQSATASIGKNPEKMFGFQTSLKTAHHYLEAKTSKDNALQKVGHAFTSLTIIQLVRICGQVNDSNKKQIYDLVTKQVNNKLLREYINYYKPQKGNSKILPVLIKLKFVRGIIWVCSYKAKKRYSKGSKLK